MAFAVSIWATSLFLTFPYAMNMVSVPQNMLLANHNGTLICADPDICIEEWPFDELRTIYGSVALVYKSRGRRLAFVCASSENFRGAFQ